MEYFVEDFVAHFELGTEKAARQSMPMSVRGAKGSGELIMSRNLTGGGSPVCWLVKHRDSATAAPLLISSASLSLCYPTSLLPSYVYPYHLTFSDYLPYNPTPSPKSQHKQTHLAKPRKTLKRSPLRFRLP